ncbi:MAG: hypothetical protein AAF718_02625 [Pseudomonadota bacterium]
MGHAKPESHKPEVEERADAHCAEARLCIPTPTNTRGATFVASKLSELHRDG